MAENTIKKGKSRIRLVILLVILMGVIVIAVIRFTNVGVRIQARSQADIPFLDEKSDTNILVAYFTAAENSDVDAISSASVTVVNGVAKGNVRAIADRIAERTGADLYSIQTDYKYPGSYRALTDKASAEQKNDERPKLLNPISNMDKYDVVFIGYPTWWYDMPQPLYSFFDLYDFSGKTIILFNSAMGSRFGGTESTIRRLEPEAIVIDGGISTYNDQYDENEVDEWLDSLNIKDMTAPIQEGDESMKAYDFSAFSNVEIIGVDLETLSDAELSVLYRQAKYCQAMTEADTDTMAELVAEDVTFTHMSGLQQTREEYFADIESGGLRYFTIGIENPVIEIDGNFASVHYTSVLNANAYGSRGTYRMEGTHKFENVNGEWVATKAAQER